MGKNPSMGQKLTTVFNFRPRSFPITYPGVPLSPYAPKKRDWDKVINHIERRLDGWHANLFSIGENHPDQFSHVNCPCLLHVNLQNPSECHPKDRQGSHELFVERSHG